MTLWISLSSPDSSTASRQWILDRAGKIGWLRLPVRYSANNKFMRRVECWLERKFYRFVCIGY